MEDFFLNFLHPERLGAEFHHFFGEPSARFPKVSRKFGLPCSNKGRTWFSSHSANAALDAAGLGETVVVVHQEVAFDLLQGVEHNAHKNQQRGSAVEVRETGGDVHERSHDGGHDGHDAEEDGTRKGDSRHDGVQIFSRLLAGLDSRNEATVLLDVFRHLVGVHRHSRIEIGEGDDHEEEHKVVPETVDVGEGCGKSREGFRLSETSDGDGQEHNGLGEDDRHDASGIHLQRDVLTHTAVLTVADHALGILYRNLARALHEGHSANHHEEQHNQLDDENQKACSALVEAGCALGHEGTGQAGNDTDHDDEGNAIANASVGDLLAEPHDEQRASHQQDDRRNPEEGSGSGTVKRGDGGNGACHPELLDDVTDVARGLDDHDDHRKVTHDLVHFLTSALTFLLQALEVRHRHAEQLDDDGRGDVRHDTQGKDGCIAEGTAREHVQQAEKTALAAPLKDGELGGVDAWDDDERSETIDQDDEDGKQDAFAQLLDLEDIPYGFNQSIHFVSYLSQVPPAASMTSLALAENA